MLLLVLIWFLIAFYWRVYIAREIIIIIASWILRVDVVIIMLYHWRSIIIIIIIHLILLIILRLLIECWKMWEGGIESGMILTLMHRIIHLLLWVVLLLLLLLLLLLIWLIKVSPWWRSRWSWYILKYFDYLFQTMNLLT